MTELNYSKNDSLRFGLQIYRGWNTEIGMPNIFEQILKNNIDIAILRIPTTKLSEIYKIGKLSMPFIITDTLAYYHFDLLAYKPQRLENRDLVFKVATMRDHEAINNLVREIFGNYVNHYRMNPFLDDAYVTEGYQDWVRSYAEADHPERKCWLVYDNASLVGFATFNAAVKPKVKGILYGVRPSERRRGIFRDIMRYAKNYYKAQGKKFMRVTTQAENIAIQHIWTSSGFSLHHLENTIHINSLLNKSVFARFSTVIKIDEKEMNTNKVSNHHILKSINYHLIFSGIFAQKTIDLSMYNHLNRISNTP